MKQLFRLSYDVNNYADLAVDNILLDLHNFSNYTQPHSRIAK